MTTKAELQNKLQDLLDEYEDELRYVTYNGRFRHYSPEEIRKKIDLLIDELSIS
jgi:hypothetical protein